MADDLHRLNFPPTNNRPWCVDEVLKDKLGVCLNLGGQLVVYCKGWQGF